MKDDNIDDDDDDDDDDYDGDDDDGLMLDSVKDTDASCKRGLTL